MVNPDLLIDAVRDKLRAMPDVVALVGGDSDRISSYEDDDDSLSAAVNQMKTPSILVAWPESGEPDNEMNPWIQPVFIYLRLSGRLGLAVSTICNGVADGDSLRFSETEFLPDFDQLRIPLFRRQQDEDGVEFPLIDMRFGQRSQN